MNENNSKKNRPKSQIMMPNSTSPLPSHSRKNGSSDSLPNHRYENEWEVRSKELAEAKARVAQMEKTMRWWSDCTDNWRKKWSEVKTERNELRKELRMTRNQLDKMMKQPAASTSSSRQDLDPLLGNMDLSRESQMNGFAIYSNTQSAIALSIPNSSKNPYQSKPMSHQYENNRITSQYAHFPPSRKNAQTQTIPLCSSQLSVIDKEIVSLMEEKVAHLTSKLDEINRRLVTERDEKAHLNLTIERLRRDLSDLHELYDSLKKELCDINGKEYTESEVESYAEDDVDEVQLNDKNEVVEEEQEIDKHTPTAEAQEEGNDIASLEVNSAEADSELSPKNEEDHNISDPVIKSDLASSIQVEISAVHKKLDLKTFINDVTDLVIGSGIGEKETTTSEIKNMESIEQKQEDCIPEAEHENSNDISTVLIQNETKDDLVQDSAELHSPTSKSDSDNGLNSEELSKS